ncbi:MAG TPA: S-layer protein [Methanoregulaceae archaeon]|nr:S-layer protein [Methanoregulaceae archaeon]
MNPDIKRSCQNTTRSRRYRFCQGNSQFWFVILVSIAFLFIITGPASAGEKYMAGEPVLSASVAGTNEFSPGQDVQLAVSVENTGVNEFKFSYSGIVDRDDLPNTAKFLTVTLENGTTPFIVKTDPQKLGDLKASSKVTGIFTVRIPSDTPSGTYSLPVNLNYTYLYDAWQYGTDTIQYDYKEKNLTFQLPVNIKPDVRVSVVSSNVSQLNAGLEGTITLTVKNIGHDNAKKAVIIIGRNGGSPVTPTQSSAYIGDFPAGGTATCVFKATVDKNAEAQTYPLDVYARYENYEGDFVNSDTETIGVPVGDKIKFTIVSDDANLSPGQKGVITALYRNSGGATAYNAQVRISMVDPFTSNDDTSYLGDIAPGETKKASFLVAVDRAATLKPYGIDSEVRYRDAFDNTIISDPVKLDLNVTEDKGPVATLLKNPVALAVIAAIIIAIGYIIHRKKANR